VSKEERKRELEKVRVTETKIESKRETVREIERQKERKGGR